MDLPIVNPNAAFQSNILGPVPSTLNSTNLSSTSTPAFLSPTPTPVYNVQGLDSNNIAAPITENPQQTDLQTRIDALSGLNDTEAGKAQYQTDQNNAAGIPDLTTSQNDLATRLTGLKNEALAIPLQLQNDSTGRGITEGGLAPIQDAALRENAIKSLTVSSLLDATQGLLTTAQAKADRAVADKYGPIEAQIDAAKANIQLVLNSPNYTIAEKNQAQDTANRLDAQKAAIADQKQTTTDIYKVATDAASNSQNFTATPQYPTVATALDAITKAADKSTALQIAATTGLTQKGDTVTTTANGLEQGNTFVSGSLQYPATQYKADQQALLSSRGSDGWVDPAVYLSGLKKWEAHGGLQSDFVQVFPVKDYINPANTWPEIIALGGGTKPKAPTKSAKTSSGLY